MEQILDIVLDIINIIGLKHIMKIVMVLLTVI